MTSEQQKTESTESQESKRSTNLRSTEEVRECRICYKRFEESEVTAGQVINPCNCQGMYAFTHKQCIETRLAMNGHTSCDICRFPFVMKRYRKSCRDWIKIFPNKEEIIELSIRWLNLANITIIWLITLNYSHYPITYLWKYVLWFFTVFRFSVLLYLSICLVWELYLNFSLWKTKNFRVEVKQNPDYKSKPGYQKSKSPSRVSGAFPKRDSSPKKDK